MTFCGKTMPEFEAESKRIQTLYEETEEIISVGDITFTRIVASRSKVQELRWSDERLPEFKFFYEKDAGGIVASYSPEGKHKWSVLILPDAHCNISEEKFGRAALKIAGYMMRAEDLIEAAKVYELSVTNALRAMQGSEPLALSERFPE